MEFASVLCVCVPSIQSGKSEIARNKVRGTPYIEFAICRNKNERYVNKYLNFFKWSSVVM